MNRSEFAKKNGATCVNERFAWSYINEKDEFIIFGAWTHHMRGDMQLILSPDWERNAQGRKSPGYGPSIRHIERIIEDKYKLFTFPMIAVAGTEKGPAKIKSFKESLSEKKLHVIDSNYYAVPTKTEANAIIEGEVEYWEGAPREIVQTSYERNPDARRKCLREYGHACKVCGFDFQTKYGDLGRGYIHVHHIILVSERKTSYKIDPIKDMRPVCPNCHAMLHKRRKPFSIAELKELLSDAETPANEIR